MNELINKQIKKNNSAKEQECVGFSKAERLCRR
jgi:hypothetical protein